MIFVEEDHMHLSLFFPSVFSLCDIYHRYDRLEFSTDDTRQNICSSAGKSPAFDHRIFPYDSMGLHDRIFTISSYSFILYKLVDLCECVCVFFFFHSYE